MPMPGKVIIIPSSDLRGSRLRCLLLTHQAKAAVAFALAGLVQPFAAVTEHNIWMPRGLCKRGEAKLGETEAFLSDGQREAITSWWLKVRQNANTPNWDIVSTCDIEGKPGLLLVEAKAHNRELSAAGKPPGHQGNEARIRAAIEEASVNLNGLINGWRLASDSHYQLCNRFAWSWKIASLGVPVILVYLGFLNAEEMSDQGQPFRSHKEWTDLVRSYAAGIVPDAAWERTMTVHGTPMRALIRSMDLRWECFR